MSSWAKTPNCRRGNGGKPRHQTRPVAPEFLTAANGASSRPSTNETTHHRRSIGEPRATATLRQSGTEMDVVGRRRYVEAVPRGLLVALVPAAAAAACCGALRVAPVSPAPVDLRSSRAGGAADHESTATKLKLPDIVCSVHPA